MYAKLRNLFKYHLTLSSFLPEFPIQLFLHCNRQGGFRTTRNVTLLKLLCYKALSVLQLHLKTAIKRIANHLCPPGTQSALPLSYHQETSAPNAAPPASRQGEIRSRTYTLLFSLWQVRSKTRTQVRDRKLQGLGQPSELMLTTPEAARGRQQQPQQGELQAFQPLAA